VTTTAPTLADQLPEVAAAAERLRHLGFLLVSPVPPGSGESQLLVSLRSHATLEHFDAQTIRYWRTGQDRRGHPAELDVGTAMPLATTFAWGKIELVDRLGVENAFVTLGGTLRADRVAPDETVAVFRSPAPIMRVGGHSQAGDVLGPELGAFFGRLMVPIDFDPGVEEAIAAADPMSRYAAFVAYQADRYRGHLLLRQEHPEQAGRAFEEARRMRRARPEAWARGLALLDRLDVRR